MLNMFLRHMPHLSLLIYFICLVLLEVLVCLISTNTFTLRYHKVKSTRSHKFARPCWGQTLPHFCCLKPQSEDPWGNLKPVCDSLPSSSRNTPWWTSSPPGSAATTCLWTAQNCPRHCCHERKHTNTSTIRITLTYKHCGYIHKS